MTFGKENNISTRFRSPKIFSKRISSRKIIFPFLMLCMKCAKRYLFNWILFDFLWPWIKFGSNQILRGIEFGQNIYIYFAYSGAVRSQEGCRSSKKIPGKI